jgi:predicted DsbA family dithiol-disulfide isomerase
VIEIEIFSDVICPWCFIGKARLDAVLQTSVGEGVSLRWRPYQLQPQIPPEGLDRALHLTHRYGAQADLAKAPERIVQEAQAEGLHLRYDLIKRMPNTRLAHQVLTFAFPYGVQHRLAQILFEDYFCRGVDVGDIEQLMDAASQVDLPLESLREYLADNKGFEEIEQQRERAADLGLSGVPGYYLADRFLLPGAQDQATMKQIIQRVKDKLAAESTTKPG